MTDKEKIEKMVAEIDRLLSIKDLGFEDGAAEHGYKNCLRDLKRFYNSMQVSPCLKCEGDGLPGTCASISELGRCPLKNQKQEPVSEDLEAEIERVRKHHFINDDFDKAELDGRTISNIARHFADWQKEQMKKEAITGQLENREDYLRIKCLYTSCRPQDDGKLIKFIIIKED